MHASQGNRVSRRTGGVRARAFTLVEILVVVAIIGLASAVVVPQMLKPGKMHVQAAARMIIADLLYAQNDAIAKQATRRVVFSTTNNSYHIEDGAGQVIAVNWKQSTGVGNYVTDFDTDSRFIGVTISAVDFNSTDNVAYDALGGPSQGGTVEVTAANATYVITVAPLTGRVTVAPK